MRTLRTVLAGVAALLAITGCAAAPAGTAAKVGDQAISVSEVEEASETIASVVGVPASEINQGKVLELLVRGDIADQIAQTRDITISDGDRDKAIAGSSDDSMSALLGSPEGRELAYNIVDIGIVATRLGADGLARALADIPVTVNPRFGTWSASDLSVTPDLGSLAKPVATASPTEPES